MNASSMRRLAKDQATLRTSTPPNYLFPQGDELPDDLTQLIILITGAHGTPYSQGLWKLHLKMPEDYPINPPKATFKTRIFHPNVDESTGAVCLETLKRDWDKKLTLKDILITISCLLINPNPDSALNADAGSLLQEDYDAFARKARLMTSIHAPIPRALKEAVSQAKRRGEEEGTDARMESEERPATSRAVSNTTAVVMKSRNGEKRSPSYISEAPPLLEGERDEDDTKENDPLHSPLLTAKTSVSRKVLGKRALSDLPTPIEVDSTDPVIDDLIDTEKDSCAISFEPPRKSPKLARLPEDRDTAPTVHSAQEYNAECRNSSRTTLPTEDKENIVATSDSDILAITKSTGLSQNEGLTRPTLRKVSNVGSSRGKALPRVGIRRL